MENIKSFITKKVVLGVFVLVIAGELIWAGWTLFKPQSNQAAPVLEAVEVADEPTVIKLESSDTQVKVGAKLTVSLQMVSNKKTDGADVIINYDPKALSVELVGKVPVILGDLYNEYPVNAVDPKLGKITVSGISTGESGTLGNGLLGSIVFTAKQAGQTKVSVDFAAGVTTDSNVLQTGTGEDVLSSVENLDITILP